MYLSAPPPLLKLLADDLRWQLVQALALSDRKVQELTALVNRPVNLVSYHLRRLRGGGLVDEHRSHADARDIYYRLNLEHLRALMLESAAQIHPALVSAEEEEPMSTTDSLPPTRILYLCTHNSARSQMAEAITRALGKAGVEVQSAGTEVTRVNPFALEAMAERSIPMEGARSKHLNEFLDESWDYVITTCDSAKESCPVFPGAPTQYHWSLPDPSAAEGTEAEKLAFFRKTADELTTRIRHLLMVVERERRNR